MIPNSDTANLVGSEMLSMGYQPRKTPHFEPERIVITKGSLDDVERASLADAICALYPQADVVKRLDLPHNRIEVAGDDLLRQHYQGKKTLVFGVHKSALRYSEEDGNACPNYWHFSPYGFCPYDCQYCYLAGTPGVKYSPVVKIFVNLRDILVQMEGKLGKENPISCQLDGRKSADGRVRFPFALRVRIYRHLIDHIRRMQPGLDISLCLEEQRTFDALSLREAVGRCNCVV